MAMTTDMDPGPASDGIANGVKEISLFFFDSFFASSEISSDSFGLSMLNPTRMMIRPPATRMAGMDMPKNSIMIAPDHRNVSRIPAMKSTALKACCLDHSLDCPLVKDKYKGTVLNGFDIGNKAKNVMITISNIPVMISKIYWPQLKLLTSLVSPLPS